MITDAYKELGSREAHWNQAKNIEKVEYEFPPIQGKNNV